MIIAEENFDSIFSKIYECEFIDHFFGPNDSEISKEEFTALIAGNHHTVATCDWIFSTLKLRNLFMENIDFEDYKEIIDDFNLSNDL